MGLVTTLQSSSKCLRTSPWCGTNISKFAASLQAHKRTTKAHAHTHTHIHTHNLSRIHTQHAHTRKKKSWNFTRQCLETWLDNVMVTNGICQQYRVRHRYLEHWGICGDRTLFKGDRGNTAHQIGGNVDARVKGTGEQKRRNKEW